MTTRVFRELDVPYPLRGIVGCTVPPIPRRGPPMIKSPYKPYYSGYLYKNPIESLENTINTPGYTKKIVP